MTQPVSSHTTTNTDPTQHSAAWKQLIPSSLSSKICAITSAIFTAETLVSAAQGASPFRISWQLGSSLFYGLCASNAMPGIAKMGATFASFSCLGARNTPPASEYYSFTFGLIDKGIDNACTLIGNAMKPICQHILFPSVEKIIQVVLPIFSFLASIISLPINPMWYGVAFITCGIAMYQGTKALYHYFSPRCE